MICPTCDTHIPDDIEPHHDHEEWCEWLGGSTPCRCELRVHPECCRFCVVDPAVTA